MPFIRLKIAASLDGITALPNGASQWITSDEARLDGHSWRAQADAVLTGIGTVLADNPRLDVRTSPAPANQPVVVVVDSQLRTPPDASLFIATRRRIICSNGLKHTSKSALEAAGASVLHLPGIDGKVDLVALMAALDAQGIGTVHVEAGAVLNGALAQAGLVDEWLIYLAPVLLGNGRGMVCTAPLKALVDAQALDIISTAMVGPDLRLLARTRSKKR